MSPPPDQYDVFFSYHGQDREDVEGVARALRARGLKVFLAQWYLQPGRPWPQALEEVLSSCRAVAVFLGRHGMGRWQQREKDLALDRQVHDPPFPVIPVLLAPVEAGLGFLGLNTWVDLSRQPDDPLALEILAAAVRREAPGPDFQERIQATLAQICPYRGLRHFREEDASFFFGRETFTEKVLQAVRRQSLVALVGASGCGKSSVARAGLVPCLRRQSRGTVWDVAAFVPGDRPLQALAAALMPLLEPKMTETERLREVGKLGKAFAEGEVALRDVVARALEQQPGTDRLLLLADQWEELYTLCPDEPVRCRFIDQLLEATAKGSLTVVLTLRGDFFGHALSYRPLADRLQDAVVILGPMSGQELERAIVKPAEKVHLTFEPGLIKRILNDVRQGAGSLPLLEFVLTELWKERHGGQLLHEVYEAMGGVQGAIACRAEEVFARLTPPEQKLVQSVFMQLVKLGEGGEDTRRRAALTEVPESAQPLVKHLADARLLVTGQDRTTGVESVEVAHEALIRNWERLRGWVDQDREFLLWSQRLKIAHAGGEHAHHDADTLLRGASLTEAERWLAVRPQDLPADEQDFIRESVAAREREREAKERERATRERSRRRMTAGAFAAALVFLVLAVLAGVQWRRAGNEARRAEQEQQRAKEQAQIAISNEKKADEQRRIALSRQLAAQALSRLDTHFDLALLLGVESCLAQETYEAKSVLLTALFHNRYPGVFLSGHKDKVQTVAFSPGGKTLASGSMDHSIILWDVVTRQPIGKPLTGHKEGVSSVAFSPDGKFLASSSEDGTVILWDVAAGQPLGKPLTAHKGRVSSVAFSPDGKTLASGHGYKHVILWDVDSRQPVDISSHQEEGKGTSRSLFGPRRPRDFSLAFSPDGKFLALAGWAKGVILWDVAARKPLEESLQGDKKDVSSVAFNLDGKFLASGNYDGTVTLWHARTLEPIGDLAGHNQSVSSVAFSPNGKFLASASRDNTVLLWYEDSGNVQGVMVGGGGSVAFSPDGKTLASGGPGITATLWDLTRPQSIGEPLELQTTTVHSVAFSPDGKTLASGNSDGTVILWDMSSRQTLGEPLTHQKEGVTSVAFSPDGKTLASGNNDKTVILWDVSSRQTLGELLTRDNSTVRSLSFSPDGKFLASGSYDGTFTLWDVTSGQPLGELLRGRKGWERSLAFSPDGKFLALGSFAGTVTLWDVTSRQSLGELLTGDNSTVGSLAFSPDGKILASVTGSKTVIFWDVSSHQPIGEPLRGLKAWENSLAFSPDGKILALGSFPGTVTLWDVTSHELLIELLTGGWLRVNSVAFSPDGKTLATGGDETTITLWDVDPESWQARACRMANRNLTRSERRQFMGEEPYRKTCPDLPEPKE